MKYGEVWRDRTDGEVVMMLDDHTSWGPRVLVLVESSKSAGNIGDDRGNNSKLHAVLERRPNPDSSWERLDDAE